MNAGDICGPEAKHDRQRALGEPRPTLCCTWIQSAVRGADGVEMPVRARRELAVLGAALRIRVARRGRPGPGDRVARERDVRRPPAGLVRWEEHALQGLVPGVQAPSQMQPRPKGCAGHRISSEARSVAGPRRAARMAVVAVVARRVGAHGGRGRSTQGSEGQTGTSGNVAYIPAGFEAGIAVPFPIPLVE
jgi:hypothetical protein